MTPVPSKPKTEQGAISLQDASKTLRYEVPYYKDLKHVSSKALPIPPLLDKTGKPIPPPPDFNPRDLDSLTNDQLRKMKLSLAKSFTLHQLITNEAI